VGAADEGVEADGSRDRYDAAATVIPRPARPDSMERFGRDVLGDPDDLTSRKNHW